MSEQQSTSRRNVLVAGVAVTLAAFAFVAAFLLFDGATIFRTVFMGDDAPVAPSRTESSTPDPIAPLALQLPDGMPEEFALRLWQEQLDSQEMIGRLADGEIRSLAISRVEASADEATLTIAAEMLDKTSVSGVLGLRRFGENWFIASVTSARNVGANPVSPDLPSVDDVDVALLNTILTEQVKSQPVIDEYLEGGVYRVAMDEVRPGPDTATIDVTMHEDHGKAFARLVLIRSEVTGRPRWFIAHFTKTGHDPPNL